MKTKILVVDDEPGIRGLLATILERKGYAVLLAESGKKGLDLFRRERPDLIVLDLKNAGHGRNHGIARHSWP